MSDVTPTTSKRSAEDIALRTSAWPSANLRVEDVFWLSAELSPALFASGPRARVPQRIRHAVPRSGKSVPRIQTRHHSYPRRTRILVSTQEWSTIRFRLSSDERAEPHVPAARRLHQGWHLSKGISYLRCSILCLGAPAPRVSWRGLFFFRALVRQSKEKIGG
jgi:hypothetical protein